MFRDRLTLARSALVVVGLTSAASSGPVLASGPPLALAAAAWFDEVVQLYRCQHRPTWELLPLAESTLGSRGRVAEDGATSSLILAGDPESVARAIAVLKAMDVAPKTLDLHYEIVDEEDLQGMGLRLDWRDGRGGLRLATAGPEAASVRTRSTSRGRVRVQEGSPGRISAGELIPVPYGPRGRAIPVAAEQGLLARPEVLGDGRIQLDFSLTDATRVEPGGVGYTAAQSRVVVGPGESVVVGAIGGEESGRSAGTDGFASGRRSGRKVLVIRAELVEDPTRR